MKKLIPVFVVVAMLAMTSIALARGAPNEKTFTDQAIVSVDVSPVVANVPLMTGFDVIQNQNTAVIRAGNAQHYKTKVETGLSTTGDEYASTSVRQPATVLLA